MVVQTARILSLHPERVALPAGPKPLRTCQFPQYRACGLAYKGSGKWALGFVHTDNAETREWLDNLSWDEVLAQLEKHHRFLVRQDDEAIFGG
jgi:hypothetical protein